MTTIRAKRDAANSMSWVIATTERPAPTASRRSRPDLRDAVGVLAGRRLVEHEDRRVHREDAGQGDELAPRQVQVVRVRRALFGQPDGGEAGLDERRSLGRRDPEIARAEGDLALDGPLEELLVGVLEDEPDRPGQVGDRTIPVVGAPSRRTRPSAGRRRPLRCLTSVVLPDPFWPRMATASPGSIDSETPRTASIPVG